MQYCPPASCVRALALASMLASSASVFAQQTGPSASVPLTEPAPPLPPAPPDKLLQWQIGETTVKIGGYIKVDLIHDFDAIGSTGSFDPRTIPTDGSDGTNTLMQARTSRLNLDVHTPTSAGPMRAFIEGDFYGDGNSFRLRHAFATIGPVLGGQTWSTFMDEDCMPETLDFESPIAFPLVRQAQIRYTHPFDDGGCYMAFALENPDAELQAPTGVMGQTEELMPDLDARFRWAHDRGHVQLGTFLGMARFEPDMGSSDDVTLWGLNLSTKYATWGADEAFVQLTYGDGVGRYRGGLAAAPDADGNLEAVPVFAVLVGYEHHWSEVYRSTVSYSWGEGDLPEGSASDQSDELQYLAANFIWQFADRAWTGIEYLYGSNEVSDGSDGDASRIQISLRFDL